MRGLLFALFIVSITAQTIPLGTSVVGTACTSVTSCLADFYNCSSSSCTGGFCVQQVRPSLSPCADLRNSTNWDSCEQGVCVGQSWPSQWVQLSTGAITGDPRSDGLYTASLQKLLCNSLQPPQPLPACRVCFDQSQLLTVVVINNQQTVSTCSPFVVVTNITSNIDRIYGVWLELVQGPATTLSASVMAQQVIASASAKAYSSLLIQSAQLSSSPFGMTFTNPLPWINGPYLAISIAVACGLFALTLISCVIFYCIKSKREIGASGVSITDSTASVQSGSSFRETGESQASAAEL